eukprot:1392360-Pyramimonas_sp.AAC.1
MYGAEPTYGVDPTWDKFTPGTNVSRPDLVIVNTAARDAIKTFRLRRDLGIKSHLGLEMVLNVVQLTNTFDSIKIPRAYPVDSVIKINAEESDALGRQSIEAHYEAFEQALVDERAEDAWAL